MLVGVCIWSVNRLVKKNREHFHFHFNYLSPVRYCRVNFVFICCFCLLAVLQCIVVVNSELQKSYVSKS